MNALDKIKKYFGIQKPEQDSALSEVLHNYDIVSVNQRTDSHGPFIVVTEKGSANNKLSFVDPDKPSFNYENSYSPQAYLPLRSVAGSSGLRSLKEKPDFSEIGSSSPSPFGIGFSGREYNADLEGQRGLDICNKMRNDGVIAGALLLFKTPVYAANWFMSPASQDDIDKEISEFCWKCLTEYMSITWTQVKTEAMLMCEFGNYIFEKCWEVRKIDGVKRVVLKKLAPRHPMDVIKWNYDDHGGPESVDIYRTKDDTIEEVNIKIKKLLVLTLNREANDITGRSMLRPMYKHWYFKEQLYKIDGIQKERHGIGIPIIKLPPNFDDDAKTAANELGRNLRTNERAHIVLPPGWEVFFAKLEGQPVNVITSIELHDKAIRESVLASFLSSDSPTKEEDVGLFLKSSRSVADSICDAFNMYLIPELVKYNFGDDAKLPKLKVRRIGEQADWRVMSFAIRSLVGAGIIRPDDNLEQRIREEMDLPVADVETSRIVQTPQAGPPTTPATTPNATPGAASGKADGTAGSTGLPRQTPVAEAKPPSANSGNDKGGQS